MVIGEAESPYSNAKIRIIPMKNRWFCFFYSKLLKCLRFDFYFPIPFIISKRIPTFAAAKIESKNFIKEL